MFPAITLNGKRILIGFLFICLALPGSGLPVRAKDSRLAPLIPEIKVEPIDIPVPGTIKGQEILWSAAAGDGIWSNPRNWVGNRVPGPADTARLSGSTPDARVDTTFDGVVGGLILEADFTGTLYLERDLTVQGDLEMAGGRLQGGKANFEVRGAAHVRGGILVTPSGATMNVVTLEISSPGIVRMGSDGKLNLSGTGQPLRGDGLIDTTAYRPNSIEYTGAATADLMTSGPTVGLNTDIMDNFQRVDALTLNAGESGLYCATIDTDAGYAYFGTFTSPGIVVKVRLDTFTRVGALTLNTGENFLISAVIDPTGGYAYFGGSTHPGTVVRVDLDTFTHAGSLTFNSGENRAKTALIDTAGGYAYFSTYTFPGKIVQVNLANFTRTGVLTLNAGENDPRSAVIDPVNGYAYFGTFTNPGIVVKVKLSDFTRVGALTLNTEEDSLYTALIDLVTGYAYFSTWTYPSTIVRLDLATFTRTGALTLNDSEDLIGSAVIDPIAGYAYYGTFTESHGYVVKVKLSDLTRVGALTLTYPECNFLSAVIDPNTGYAYFGNLQSPSIIVKIGVGESSASIIFLPLLLK